ncbi:putative uncharacterized protein DDB_G0290521 [Drosophila virilis]|uniref:Uncharacterized protein n=1 Tax=Drosophila virilis TaxID=7244 RepID=A0A0Q9WEK9_DROVI|nr:protein eyes shut [Drosophila virilis]KRF79422.1 uncharacterized protein Dvir_GJ25914 [Drosophila virilis]
MESRTTTTIEEISTEINGAIVIESFEIATIETSPTPAKRVHHEQHHHKHHHHRQHHDQGATTLTITDVSDGVDITEIEQPETEHHHHHHKDKQAEPQMSLPPPLPKSSPPYLTPSDEQDQFVWLTDLDASPQQPASLTVEPKPLAMQTPPTPSNSTGCQPLQTAAAAADTAVTAAAAVAATVSQTAFSSETQLQQSAPAPPPTETTEQAVWLTDLDAPPQQSAPLVTVKQLPQQVPAVNNSSEWVVQSLTVAATPTATATAPSVRQTELIIENQPIKAAPLAQPMVLVGEVTADTIDKRRKSYRVSMDLTAPPLQEPKKRCCCRIS